jgi:uncharacterized membrane protein
MPDTSPIHTFLHHAGLMMEVMGVSVMVIGAVAATVFFVAGWARSRSFSEAFPAYRMNIARGILLGLEFLVAADIIGTVLIAPTLENVGVLAIIVLIRTFLSYSLEIEIHGRLPWKREKSKKAAP